MSRLLASANARLAVAAAALLIFVVAGAVLIFANQGPPSQHRQFQITVAGSTMTPSRLQAYGGDTLTLSITADKSEEIHLHGYDKHFYPSPGQPATMKFAADKTGDFVIEIEATGTEVGTLDVLPRGGLFGLVGAAGYNLWR